VTGVGSEGSVEQRYEQALALHRSGRLDEADALYREVLAAEPAHFGALHLRGVIEGQRCHYAEAAALIESALRIDPDAAAAHVNLGNTQHALGCLSAALKSYERALALQPDHRMALMGQGRTRWGLGLLPQALESYNAALAIDPDCAESLMNRGDILLGMGCTAEGVASLRLAQERGADADSIRFALASSGVDAAPEQAPEAYVKSLFDRYAPRFDNELVQNLQYRGPELLLDLIQRHLPPKTAPLDVLDLGCGTGLCGALLRPLACRLNGIDLSENMLAKARERAIYDQLESAEITLWLAQCSARYDLIVATDVFIYIGDLAPVFSGARRVLRAGGRLAFSVEATEHLGYELGPTRRYRHSRGYIERLAGDHGLEVEAIEAGVLRRNDGADVSGDLVLLRKPGPA
jgi:predicted TPR repeat methyltransferase